MPLRLIAGRANTGKTGAAYSAIRNRLKDGLMPVLVVPSRPDVARAREEFAHEPSLGLRILTFDDYVRGLWEETTEERSIVAIATIRMLVSACVREAGLDQAHTQLVMLLAQELSEHAGTQWRGRSRAYRGRESGIANALALLGRRLQEQGVVLPAEATHIVSGQRDVGCGPVVVHRFDDFTPSQMALIGALRQRAEVVVTLTWASGFTPTRVLDDLVARIAPDSTDVLEATAFNTAPELAVLAERIFVEGAPIQEAGAVAFGLAAGEEAHARIVVQEVRARLERGLSAQRIAVTARDLERHHSALARCFADAGIGADFDVRVALGQTGLGSAVLDVLSCAVTGEPTRLLSALRSPYSGKSPGEAREIETRVRRQGVATLTAQGTSSGFGVPGEMLSVLTRGRALRSDDWRECGRLAARMFAAAHRGSTRSIAGEAELDARALQAIREVLLAAEESKVPVVTNDVLMALNETRLAVGGDGGPGLVNVLPVTRLRGRRFDALIVCGLGADEFPAPQDESALPGSRLYQLFRDLGSVDGASKGPDYEELLFYETVSRASSRVVFVAKTADDEGQALRLSPFFERAAGCYRPDWESPEVLPGFTYGELAFQPRRDGGAREALRAAAREGDQDARSLAALNRRRGRAGCLRDLVVLGPEVLSASQIEDYIACPYRWFYRHVVGASELETTFGSRDEGVVAHKLLQATYERLAAEGTARVTPGCLSHALEVLDEIAAAEASAVRTRSVAERVGRSMARQWVARLLAEDAEDDSAFRPAHFEWSFGYDGEPIDLGGVKLRGRIDRIDLDDAGRAVVTDFKRTGPRGSYGPGLLESGRVQVLLYMEAVARGLGVQPVAGVYRGMKDASAGGVVLEDSDAAPLLPRKKAGVGAEELLRLREAAVERAAAAVGGMRAGRIQPSPLTAETCKFCPANRDCRYVV